MWALMEKWKLSRRDAKRCAMAEQRFHAAQRCAFVALHIQAIGPTQCKLLARFRPGIPFVRDPNWLTASSALCGVQDTLLHVHPMVTARLQEAALDCYANAIRDHRRGVRQYVRRRALDVATSALKRTLLGTQWGMLDADGIRNVEEALTALRGIS